MHTRSLRQLVDTLLWSSSDFLSDSDKPLDKDYGIDDVEPTSLAELKLQFEEFTRVVSTSIAEKVGSFDAIEDFYLDTRPEFPLEYDYILTRNRHGAGFWDGDWDKKVSQILTDAAHLQPEIEPYVGSDNLIHF